MRQRRERPAGRERRGREAEKRDSPADHRTPRPGCIFGTLPVLEAARADPQKIERIILAEGAREHRFREIYDIARKHDIRLDRVGREDLERLTGGANHQGIAAIVAAAAYATEEAIFAAAPPEPIYVLLDGVEDPRNFGAVLRTAECAGVDGVFIPERRAVGMTDTVAKSAAGATAYVKVARVPNLNRLIEQLKQNDIWVVGTSGDAEMEYTEWDWTRPSALVLGSEGSGLHRLVAEKCDVLVKIPMYGKIDSLNVSVAAGVVLFEARRQRLVSSR